MVPGNVGKGFSKYSRAYNLKGFSAYTIQEVFGGRGRAKMQFHKAQFYRQQRECEGERELGQGFMESSETAETKVTFLLL